MASSVKQKARGSCARSTCTAEGCSLDGKVLQPGWQRAAAHRRRRRLERSHAAAAARGAARHWHRAGHGTSRGRAVRHVHWHRAGACEAPSDEQGAWCAAVARAVQPQPPLQVRAEHAQHHLQLLQAVAPG